MCQCKDPVKATCMEVHSERTRTRKLHWLSFCCLAQASSDVCKNRGILEAGRTQLSNSLCEVQASTLCSGVVKSASHEFVLDN